MPIDEASGWIAMMHHEDAVQGRIVMMYHEELYHEDSLLRRIMIVMMYREDAS